MSATPFGGSRPLLFLDVDGVLNCEPDDRHEFHKLGGMPVWLPAGVKDRLARLLELYEPVWATAWQGSAHGAWREVLGLPAESWPYIAYRDLKLPEIVRYAGDRRWAWVDDDAKWELDELGWKPEYVAGLLIWPAPCDGLTEDHARALVEFAETMPSSPFPTRSRTENEPAHVREARRVIREWEQRNGHDSYVDCLGGGYRGYQAACWDCAWRGPEHLRGDEEMGTPESRAHKSRAKDEANRHRVETRP